MVEPTCSLCGSVLRSRRCDNSSCPSNALKEWTKGGSMPDSRIREGDVLIGSCGGLFCGYNGEKVVEGAGEDWIVVRMGYGGPRMVEGRDVQRKLKQYLKEADDGGKEESDGAAGGVPPSRVPGGDGGR